MKAALNLQDIFLNQVRKDHSPITIFLVSGYQIKGFVKGFDSYTIVIDSDGKQQMIYKHAVSTIVPSKPVNFMNNNRKPSESEETEETPVE
jgi:host factor-I protein